jgi:hypothetical protein
MVFGLLILRYPDQVRYGAMLYGLTLLVGPVNVIALPFQADLRLNELLEPSLAHAALTFVLSVGALAVSARSSRWQLPASPL